MKSYFDSILVHVTCNLIEIMPLPFRRLLGIKNVKNQKEDHPKDVKNQSGLIGFQYKKLIVNQKIFYSNRLFLKSRDYEFKYE